MGLHSEDEVSGYKPRPIWSFDERLAIVKACWLADEVVDTPVPLHCTVEPLDAIGANFVGHGDDMTADQQAYWYGAVIPSGRFRSVPYTAGISSREIVSRIIGRCNAGTLMEKPLSA